MIMRIARTAGFSGLLAALLLTLLQNFWVAPLILEAETYESAAPVAEHHEHGAEGAAAHEHSAEAWSPEDGWQRVLSTTGGNLVVAVGFALILVALYSLREPKRAPPAPCGAWRGSPCSAWPRPWACRPSCRAPLPLTWGNARPGGSALQAQPHWAWPCLVFARHWLVKALGAVLLVLPHVIGAPQPEVHQSLAPEALEAQFKVASWLTNAAFWLALGLFSAWLYRRSSQA